MQKITWIMFGCTLLTGNMGIVFLWFILWMPLAMSIQINYEIGNIGRYVSQQNTSYVNVEGAIIKTYDVAIPTEDLTVGMSMGES